MIRLLVLLLVGAILAAEDADGLALALRPLTPTPRANAPWLLAAELSTTDGRLRRGRLRLQVESWDGDRQDWTSDALAVTGTRHLPILLPTAARAFWIKVGRGPRYGATARCSWLEADGRVWSLGERTLADGARTAPVAALLGGAPATWADLVPAEPGTAFPPHWLRLDPRQAPRDPLVWLACDAVLAAPEAVAALGAGEAEALAAWVRAGGRLALAEPAPADCPLGRLLPAPTATAALGLGCVVLAMPGPATTAASTALWGIDLADLATAPEAMPASLQRMGPGGDDWQRQTPLSGMQGLLWPRDAFTVPWPLLAGVFLVLLLAIGPGDWLVLGWLRRRHWTWAATAAVSLVAAAALVLLARAYLGSGSHARSLAIVDADGSGRALRTTTITLHFRGADGLLVRDCRQTLASLGSDGRPPAMEMSGTPPASWRLAAPIAQWRPLYERQTRIGGPTAPALAIDEGDDQALLAAGRAAAAALDPLAVLLVGGPAEPLRHADLELKVLQHAITSLCGATWTGRASGWQWPDRSRPPEGGSDLGDLALLPAGDVAARVLVIVQREGDGYRAFRYRCRSTGSGQLGDRGRCGVRSAECGVRSAASVPCAFGVADG